MSQTTSAFDQHLRDWQAWTAAPWGRLRFAVVEHTLGLHATELGARLGRPLRVLDVGGGDARDSLPLALEGHEVTVLDNAPGMLAEARRRADEAGVALTTVEGSVDDLADFAGGFDLVLCHFLLHYRAADAGDVARLAGTLAPGGRLSVICPNPVSRVYQKLVQQGPAAALDELGTDVWESATFAHEGRLVTSEEISTEAVAARLTPVGLHGGRIANDLLTDNDAKHDPAFHADLVRLEIALCDREPYKRLGSFWQVVAERPAGASATGAGPRT